MTDPLDLLANTDEHEYVRKITAQLPELERLLVRMVYIEGLDVRECARVVGITTARAESLLEMGLMRLRIRLGS